MAIINGTNAADTLVGTLTIDLIVGFDGDGDDELTGSGGANELRGHDGDDMLVGGDGDDTLNGGDGNDRLTGGAGADELLGGKGADTVQYDGPAGVTVTIGGTTSGGEAEGDTVGLDIEHLVGTDQDDALTGSEFSTQLYGRGGDDHLFGLGGYDGLSGGEGNDELDGGTGADSMAGGLGDDRYRIDDATDYVMEAAGEGKDKVIASVGHILGDAFEDLVFVGTADLDGTGTVQANAITGNAGKNLLRGLGGADTLNGGGNADILVGGKGSDRLTGGSGADHFRYLSLNDSLVGAERDRVEDFKAGVDHIHLSTLDADASTAGNQAFAFLGTALFSGAAGELRVSAKGIVMGDVNGDGAADFHIQVTEGLVLSASDFVL